MEAKWYKTGQILSADAALFNKSIEDKLNEVTGGLKDSQFEFIVKTIRRELPYYCEGRSDENILSHVTVSYSLMDIYIEEDINKSNLKINCTQFIKDIFFNGIKIYPK